MIFSVPEGRDVGGGAGWSAIPRHRPADRSDSAVRTAGFGQVPVGPSSGRGREPLARVVTPLSGTGHTAANVDYPRWVAARLSQNAHRRGPERALLQRGGPTGPRKGYGACPPPGQVVNASARLSITSATASGAGCSATPPVSTSKGCSTTASGSPCRRWRWHYLSTHGWRRSRRRAGAVGTAARLDCLRVAVRAQNMRLGVLGRAGLLAPRPESRKYEGMTAREIVARLKAAGLR